MTEIPLIRYISSSIAVPLVLPMILMLIPWWHYSHKTMIKVVTALEVFIIVLYWLFYAVWGSTVFSVYLGGLLIPILCTVTLLFCCTLRDGRVSFLLLTLLLHTNLCDTLTSIFALRDQWLWIVIKIFITLTQYVFVIGFCRKYLLKMLDSSNINWGKTSFLPASLFAASLSYYYSFTIISGGRTPVIPAMLFCITTIIIYIAIFHMQQATLAQAEIKQTNALLHTEINFLERQIRQTEENQQNLKIYRHDMRHYLQLLKGALVSNNQSAMEQALCNLEQGTNQLSVLNGPKEYTGILVFDIILTEAAERSLKLGINFNVNLTVAEDLRVDLIELAIVISNGLENAINATAKEPLDKPRQVSITNIPCHKQLFIVISNTYTGKITKDPKGLPVTMEKGHGTGTLSIAAFAQKYNCLLDFSTEGNMFYLRLLI